MKINPLIIGIVVGLFIIIIGIAVFIYTLVSRWYCPECTDYGDKPCPECPTCNVCEPDDPNCDPCPVQQPCIDSCDQCPKEVCPLTWVPLQFDNKLLQVNDRYINLDSTKYNGVSVTTDPNKAHLWRYKDKKLYNITTGQYVRWIGYPINSSYNFYFQFLGIVSPPGSIEDEYEWDGYNFYLANYYDDTTAYLLSFMVNLGRSDVYPTFTISAVPRAVVGKSIISSIRPVDKP